MSAICDAAIRSSATGAIPMSSPEQSLQERHRMISEVLVRDVITKLLAPDLDARPAQDLQLRAVQDGQDLQFLEVSVRVKVTPEDLASQMLVRLDEALGLDGVMTQRTPWFAECERALGDVAIDVAERMTPAAGDAGALDHKLSAAVEASNQGAQGVAKYLIEHLGVGDAFDLLAAFAREHFAEQKPAVIERMQA